jgi:hypothetical protein
LREGEEEEIELEEEWEGLEVVFGGEEEIEEEDSPEI